MSMASDIALGMILGMVLMLQLHTLTWAPYTLHSSLELGFVDLGINFGVGLGMVVSIDLGVN